MVELFDTEEKAQIVAAALAGLKADEDKRKRREKMRALPEDAKAKSSIADTVLTAVKTNIVNKFMSLLPREVAAALQTGALFGSLAPAIPGLKTAVTIAGAATGVLVEQTRRAIARSDAKREALLQARGPFATPQATFDDQLDIDALLKDQQALLFVFQDAVTSGDVEMASLALKDMLTSGQAGMQAVRAFTDNLADQQGLTRAKTAAESAFNRREGRISMRADEAHSLINGKAEKFFLNLAKDPFTKD